jgi:hypothetical protein
MTFSISPQLMLHICLEIDQGYSIETEMIQFQVKYVLYFRPSRIYVMIRLRFKQIKSFVFFVGYLFSYLLDVYVVCGSIFNHWSNDMPRIWVQPIKDGNTGCIQPVQQMAW